MHGIDLLVTVGVRYLLVMLFFPFSALDKILNFGGAVGQAQEMFHNRALATFVLMGGLFIEIVMPLCILTGEADRLAALIMAGYCMATALLWKRFWATGDFWAGGDSRGRGLFWDFLKNCSLAGGFLMLTFGTMTLGSLIADPFSSTHPYTAPSVPSPSP